MSETPEKLAERANKQLLDQITNEYLDLAESIDKDTARKEEVARELIALLGVGGRHEVVPGVGVSIAKPRETFDPKLALTKLTSEQYAAICRPVPQADLARSLFGDVLVDMLKSSTGKPSVRRI